MRGGCKDVPFPQGMPQADRTLPVEGSMLFAEYSVNVAEYSVNAANGFEEGIMIHDPGDESRESNLSELMLNIYIYHSIRRRCKRTL